MKKSSIFFVLVGLAIWICTLYFFVYVRGFFYSFEVFIILFACSFLISITFKPHYIVGMEISDMTLATAQHYHSMITNIILGFSAAVGVIIALLWPSRGELYRTYSCSFFLWVLYYFIIVMYFAFLRELNYRIAFLNKIKRIR